MKVRIAVLDMDGTLFEGFLASHMAEAISLVSRRSGSVAQEAILAIDRYKAGHLTHDECATLFYSAYVRAIRGLPTELLQQAASKVWQHNRANLFPYASELAGLLREQSMLIASFPAARKR